MMVFRQGAFILSKFFGDLSLLSNFLYKFFQSRMILQIGIGGFKDAFVLVVEVNDALEHIIFDGVILFDLSAVKDNFMDEDFSEILEK